MSKFWILMAVVGSFAFRAHAAVNCPSYSTKVLIVDLKSGWWSGDGGDLHHQMLNKVVTDCPKLNIEYHFMNQGSGQTSFYPAKPGVKNDAPLVLANFPASPLKEYRQIWILSGAFADGADIQENSAEFIKLSQVVHDSSANLFFGTGINNFDHANVLLVKTLGESVKFGSSMKGIEFPNPSPTLKIMGNLVAGKNLVSHEIFKGIQELPNMLDIDGKTYSSDFVLADNTKFPFLATFGDDVVIRAGKLAGGRQAVLDSGIIRFYAFAAKNEAVYTYLLNLFTFLE